MSDVGVFVFRKSGRVKRAGLFFVYVFNNPLISQMYV